MQRGERDGFQIIILLWLLQFPFCCNLCSAHLTLNDSWCVCVVRRHQATHYERAYAPTPSGGTAGRTGLHGGDAHPERRGNGGFLRRSVHTGDPREGKTPQVRARAQ